MKTITKLRLLIVGAVLLQFAIINLQSAKAQCQPMIIIDGNNIVADENVATGLRLPAWLKAAQTLNIGQYVYSVSVIEFTVNGSALDYSQNLNITAASTVPAGKVWKIEAVNKNATLPGFSGTYSYSTPGTFTFTAPPCISTARVQIWGAGGGGDANNCCVGIGGAGGGGGGYAEGYYQLTASGSYTVTVGAGGAGTSGVDGNAGGSSSVSTIGISVSGGGGATGANTGANTGGAGGIGSGQLNFTGSAGTNNSGGTGGKGGDAANLGGIGGLGGSPPFAGTFPGGGGGGGNWSGNTGGAGAGGKIVISFGASSSAGSSNTTTTVSGTLTTSTNNITFSAASPIATNKSWGSCQTYCVGLGLGWHIPTFDEEIALISGAIGAPSDGFYASANVWTRTPLDVREGTYSTNNWMVVFESTGAWTSNVNTTGYGCRCVK